MGSWGVLAFCRVRRRLRVSLTTPGHRCYHHVILTLRARKKTFIRCKALACWEAPTPDDCPGKLHGSPCSPTRDGVFKVTGKTILLHVGGEAKHDLSCMTQADGVVMGCSTFGQVAGILNTGISMFSLHCGGNKTPQHYKTVPPLAVAENGRLWVPISGSWRDPVLTAVSLFRKALDALVSQRDMSV